VEYFMVKTRGTDPAKRSEGHLRIEVTVDRVKGIEQVVDALATLTLFRGFETILVNRRPWEIQNFAQLVCGDSTVAHGMAAVMALDAASRTTIPPHVRLMRNLVLGANFIMSHVLHFYRFTLPDYLDTDVIPSRRLSTSSDKRIRGRAANTLAQTVTSAFEKGRKGLDTLLKNTAIGTFLGGQLGDSSTRFADGFTTMPKEELIAQFRTYLDELLPFIQGEYVDDVHHLASVYPDYLSIGRGHGNLLTYGVFDLDTTGNAKLFRAGCSTHKAGTVKPVDVCKITEQVTSSWHMHRTRDTVPKSQKVNNLSWLNSPRYEGLSYEVGPLARMRINADYAGGPSVMDRHLARAHEALKICQAMRSWVDQLTGEETGLVQRGAPASAVSYGLTETPRGALGHWIHILKGKISRYQIITPTCWNASSRDSAGQRGPIEEALIGTPVATAEEPTEVLRVIHSFDPSLSFDVHVLRPNEDVRIFALGHVEDEEKSVPQAKERTVRVVSKESREDHSYGS
jgi:hydrogenase large subunit